MGMWQGIAAGLKDVEQKKQNEADLAFRLRQEERIEAKFEQDRQAARLSQIKTLRDVLGTGSGGLTASSSSGKSSGKDTTSAAGSGQTAKHMMSVLTKRFGVDGETLSDLYSKGGTAKAGLANIQQAYDIALAYDEKMQTGDYVPGDLNTAVGSMLSSAIVTEATEKEIDWNKVEEQLGFSVDEAMREQIGSTAITPGLVTYTAPTAVKRIPLSDLDKINNTLVSSSIALAASDKRQIKEQLSKLPEGSERTSDQAVVASYLTDRLMRITEAEEARKSDDFTPLINLYGTSALEDLQTSYKGIESAPINPAFRDAMKQPIDVGTQDNFKILHRNGVLQEGQIVTFTQSNGDIVVGPVPAMSK